MNDFLLFRAICSTTLAGISHPRGNIVILSQRPERATEKHPILDRFHVNWFEEVCTSEEVGQLMGGN